MVPLLVIEHGMVVADPTDLPFPVSAFATSAQSRLHRCERHVHLSAFASVSGRTVRLQCNLPMLSAVALHNESIRTGSQCVMVQ